MMIKILKATGLAVAGAAAILGPVAPALAGGTGNTASNCYGIYWNTDWDQKCWTGGASQRGWFTSYADCSAQGDKLVDVGRLVGDGQTVDGPDCRFSVNGVRTVVDPF
jgi:hypothetical protein